MTGQKLENRPDVSKSLQQIYAGRGLKCDVDASHRASSTILPAEYVRLWETSAEPTRFPPNPSLPLTDN